MSFLRSSQGISNYPAFYGVDFIVFTEGRVNITKTNDESFYKAILSLSTQKSFKIKTVGSCIDTINYFDIIKNQNLDKALVFLDKDLNEITKTSIITDHRLILTYGYSWESDFWSIEIIEQTLKILGRGSLQQNDVDSIKKCIKTAHILSSLDAAAQTSGENIIKKDSGTGGIDFSKSKSSLNLIHRSERIRLSKKYNLLQKRKCDVSKKTIEKCMKSEPEKIIQGHLMENIHFHILTRLIKKHTGANIDFKLISNTAFHIFEQDCNIYLSLSKKQHYTQKIQDFIIKSCI